MEQFAKRTKFNSISLVVTKELKDDMKPVKKFADITFFSSELSSELLAESSAFVILPGIMLTTLDI